ncbi:hypothetical protein NE852_20140 [Rhizobium sp. Pop5]|uniref:hypothetical protein n=1 Tax=Rhizobium sp. Pop5 TaxID=1223565 RepID=UPI000283BAF9|nr:hypothetical protein [Rhizobium sp. Pop5]EJZ21138.1 hypothetical protein RCCGEPOP_11626 [Rhizobium sp. Pop5]UVD56353.1 hypothetical protein NE852_20140 [Rhizobium sp. Pop5]
MKQFILACTLAAASVFSTMPSQAASVTITTDNARPYYGDPERSYYRDSERPYYRYSPYYRHHMMSRRVSEECFTKTERIRRHGHTVIKETRICR